MSTILDAYNKIRNFNWAQAIEEAINEHSDELSRIQVEQQYAGINSKGTPIEPPYTKKTVQIKTEKGQPTDRVTLRDTGEFHAGVRVYAESGKIIHTSLNDKLDLVEGKYGEDIWGFSSEYSQRVKDILLPTLRRKFNEAK